MTALLGVRSLNDVGARRGRAFAAGVLGLRHRLVELSRAIVVVVCDISVLAVAPCQCRSLGAISTRIAGVYPLRGLVLLADNTVARRDLEQLPVLTLMPDRPPVRREHDGADVHTVGTFSTFLVVARNPKRSQGCERRYGVCSPFAAG